MQPIAEGAVPFKTSLLSFTYLKLELDPPYFQYWADYYKTTTDKGSEVVVTKKDLCLGTTWQLRCFDFAACTFFRFGYNVHHTCWETVIRDEFVQVMQSNKVEAGDLIVIYIQDKYKQLQIEHFARFLKIYTRDIMLSQVIHKTGIHMPQISCLKHVIKENCAVAWNFYREVNPARPKGQIVKELLETKEWLDATNHPSRVDSDDYTIPSWFETRD